VSDDINTDFADAFAGKPRSYKGLRWTLIG